MGKHWFTIQLNCQSYKLFHFTSVDNLHWIKYALLNCLIHLEKYLQEMENTLIHHWIASHTNCFLFQSTNSIQSYTFWKFLNIPTTSSPPRSIRVLYWVGLKFNCSWLYGNYSYICYDPNLISGNTIAGINHFNPRFTRVLWAYRNCWNVLCSVVKQATIV